MKQYDQAISIATVKTYFISLQQRLCQAFGALNRTSFQQQPWQKPDLGNGITCILENGAVIEKAGVNFSHVFGKEMPAAATAKRPALAGCEFQALGISIVIHPRNPYAPTAHTNLRLFIAENQAGEPIWWFGGGFDLTPYYGFEEDCQYWHQMAKQACDPFGADVYSRYKKWCDDYFYLKHRNEPRGIGGIFFDDLNEWNFERCFEFIKTIGEAFLEAYQTILLRRKDIPYSEKEREFQLYRRGRYVEFNLVYDRGTLFGLQTNGRTESILMSLPPLVSWRYDWQPLPGSQEEDLYKNFLIAKDWLAEK